MKIRLSHTFPFDSVEFRLGLLSLGQVVQVPRDVLERALVAHLEARKVEIRHVERNIRKKNAEKRVRTRNFK